MAKERAINNAKWQSSLDGRMQSADVRIETAVHKDGSAELQFEFDVQKHAIIKLTIQQKEQLIRKLQASIESEFQV